jgi:hypothetical protein
MQEYFRGLRDIGETHGLQSFLEELDPLKWILMPQV